MLRIGMECHPCEKWLTEKISQFLIEWPRVDVELKNTFRYDGITALKANEIDLLVTPDPIENEHLHFTPVLDYTLCLVVSGEHPLARKQHIVPQDLAGEVLFTVPVSTNRLDLYTQFLSPAKVNPKRRISMDSVEMILRMVSANRGVSVLPDWLISPYQASLNIKPITIGHRGISKSINLGIRNEDTALAYMKWLISK
jgi:LysR family transcriptional regulator for metE and metH